MNYLIKSNWLFVRLLIYIVFVYLFLQLYNLFPVYIASVETAINNVLQIDSSEKFSSLEENFSVPVSLPQKIIIPKIGVDAKIESVGLNYKKEMGVPKNLFSTGWYMYGPKPGEVGNAVIAGHEVDAYGLGVIFKNLHLLKEGDNIYVLDEKNNKMEFVVKKIEVYDFSKPPLDEIFGKTNERNLNLITCSGSFLKKLSTKNKRLVVYTQRI